MNKKLTLSIVLNARLYRTWLDIYNKYTFKDDLDIFLKELLDDMGIEAKIYKYNMWKVRFNCIEDLNLFVLLSPIRRPDSKFILNGEPNYELES